MAFLVHAASILLVPLVNILFFVVIQTAFFWLVGSQEAVHVVKSKGKVLSEGRRMLQASGQHFATVSLDTVMSDMAEQVSDPRELERLHKENQRENWALVKRYIGPWVIAAGALLVACLLVVLLYPRGRGETGSRLGLAHGVGLALVVVSYLGEVLLFLYVIQRYMMFGDFEMTRLLLGCTPAGTTYVPPSGH